MAPRRYNIPSTSSLIAFEAVARLRGFARAAEELNTSQSAISRHIRNLEIRFGTKLFDRDGRATNLTPKGTEFHAGVLQALDRLQTSVNALSYPKDKVTLVCSHSVSHLLLMSHYTMLRRSLGPGAELRFLTAEYNLIEAAIDTGADIVFEYSTIAPEQEHVVVCDEEVIPVGTPEVIEQTSKALNGKGPGPLLLELKKQNFGWTSWADWKDAHPNYHRLKVSQAFDSYVYLLEAAANGEGLALGWRGFVERHLERGQLVEMPCSWHSRDTRIYARLTRFGRYNAKARACLSLLENLGYRTS